MEVVSNSLSCPLCKIISICAIISVSGIECYALIETCGGGVPCLDEITRMFRGPFSDDGRSVPIECVAGRQAM